MNRAYSAARNIFHDTHGTIYVAAEHREQLFWLCDRFGRSRGAVRYNFDLKCFVLEFRDHPEKECLKQFISKRNFQNNWQRKPTKKRRRRKKVKVIW